MNLRHRLGLAGNALLAMLDPEHDHMPTGGYEVAHDLGRWWDAVLRLEEAIGFSIPAELEAASLSNLQRLTDNPDRLLLNRLDVPWLVEKAKLNPHNLRETLLAYGGLVRRRSNRWAREAALHLVGVMDRSLGQDGRFDFAAWGSWGSLPRTTDPTHSQAVRDGWFDGTANGGRSLEALVWLYESAGEPLILDVAQRLAERHLDLVTSPDGAIRRELSGPDHTGHMHSYLGTLRGLLLFGLLTGQRAYVDAIEATYRNAVRIGLMKESGWVPHDLGKNRFPNECGDPVTDPASAGDAAQLALWLALRAGCHDLLDDVERIVRARLLPAQLTQEDVRRNSQREFAPRDIGAWCIHGPSHGGKGCTPDVLAAVAHTLCDVYNHVCSDTLLGLRVNLHLNHEDSRAKVVSCRGERGCVTVWPKRRESVLIRVPGWVPRATLRLAVDDQDLAPRLVGEFVWIPANRLREESRIELSYDLPERESEEVMPSGRRYRFQWRGDEIVGVDPQDEPLPFYPLVRPR
jgi:hypothetical protein